jgi:hypothetical protein
MQNGKTYSLRCLHSILHCALFILHLIRGCGSTVEYGCAKAETTVQLRPPAPFWWEMEWWSNGVLVYCLQTFPRRFGPITPIFRYSITPFLPGFSRVFIRSICRTPQNSQRRPTQNQPHRSIPKPSATAPEQRF